MGEVLAADYWEGEGCGGRGGGGLGAEGFRRGLTWVGWRRADLGGLGEELRWAWGR